ncbi:hypothetical protein, partial [Streptomyces sp. NPDC052042]|uniref:DUF7507 domain-containing protein n=1 Tax=Streptomyces sp. NPDC052042 TaxID=3365683 RepID=UPI0037D80D10
MSLTLAGGYQVSFVLKKSTPSGTVGSVVAPRKAPLENRFSFGTAGYVGVPGSPILYSGTETGNKGVKLALSDIVVKDNKGVPVSGFRLVIADAENNIQRESFTWSSDKPLTQVGVLQPAAPAGCTLPLQGIGTNTVTCTGKGADPAQPIPNSYYNAVLVGADTPTTLSLDMRTYARSGVAFAVQTSRFTVNKQVVDRINASDSFDVSVVSPEGSALATGSTGTDDTATTGPTTVLNQPGGGAFSLSEAPTAGTPTVLSNYAQQWSCSNAASGSPTRMPQADSGTSVSITPAAGDDITCTVTNTALAASIELVKHAGTPTDVNADGLVDEGDTIPYTFTVKNTGRLALRGITVSDPKVGAVDCPQDTLAPGESQVCTAAAPYTITAADVLAGGVDNTATASGFPSGSDTAVKAAPSTTHTPTTKPAPEISLVKSASPSDAAAYTAGQPITYTFVVTNTGNVTLKDVKVDEGEFTGTGKLSPISCPKEAASLAPGAQVTCTATYTVTQADVDAGSVKNSATGTGTPPKGEPPVSPPSETTVPAPSDPALTVVKTSSTDKLVADEKVTYDFAVTNTGNVTLKDIKVKEGEFTGHGELDSVVCPKEAESLVPGATVTCTATYTVTQADVDAGSVKNSATATGTPPKGEPPVSPPSETTVKTDDDPGLAVVKTGHSSDPDKLTLGEEITYDFAVTNTGNVTLKDVKVKEGEFTGHGKLSPVSCPAKETESLAPGKTVTCTATYTVTQQDIDAGSITNSATATGTPPKGEPPVSPPSETTVPAPEKPALSVVKTGHSSDPDKLTLGEEITYDFAVTNTGNVTLKDVKVKEGEFTGHGDLSAVVCPAKEAESLAPGAQMTCTATYTVTQQDIDAGSITNSATATGTPPKGEPPVSPPSETTVPAPSNPALKVVKSASADTLVAGEKITYSFAVTNTGDVTLKNVKVDEGEFTGHGKLDPVSCPTEAASLAPGKTMTCTATYTVTQADVDAGSVKNSATATGTPPKGEPPVSPPSETTVKTDDDPGLAVVKSASTANPAVGDEIIYKFAVTNTGNVTLKNVKVDEGEFTGHGKLDPVSCPTEAASLAPGKTM